jgi:hypothetical protein
MKTWDPGSGLQNLGIRDKTSRIRNTDVDSTSPLQMLGVPVVQEGRLFPMGKQPIETGSTPHL